MEELRTCKEKIYFNRNTSSCDTCVFFFIRNETRYICIYTFVKIIQAHGCSPSPSSSSSNSPSSSAVAS